MSLAIKFGDYSTPNQDIRGIIYLDATTQYGKKFGGKVTSHPIESGANVSDHFTVQNPKFQVNGVISGADLSPIPSNIFLEDEGVMNANQPAEAATIVDLNSTLRKFVPDSLGQFVPSMAPQVIGGNTPRTDFKEQVEALLELIMSGLYFNEQRNRWENRMVLITLYETIGSYLGKSRYNLVLTDYSVRETVETGNGLFLELAFEQVRFATSEKAEAPKPAKGSDTAKKAGSSQNKGTAKTETIPPPETDYGGDMWNGTGPDDRKWATGEAELAGF